MTISKTDAIELAHTYAWYRDAIARRSDEGVCIYGAWLLSMQDRMGVEVTDPETVQRLMRFAEYRLEGEAA